jgi:ribosomal protein L24E
MEDLNLYWLLGNPRAIHLIDVEEALKTHASDMGMGGLENHKDLWVGWTMISKNPGAIEILKRYPEQIDWNLLSGNPSAIQMITEALKHDPKKINWTMLSGNSGAIEILKQYPDKINWDTLSGNSGAICLIEEALKHNPEKINWERLSRNPNAIHILERNLEKIIWSMLSTNPNAISLLTQHFDKINWGLLSTNPNAISLLEQNPDNISWGMLSMNTNPIAMQWLEIKYKESNDNSAYIQHLARKQHLFVNLSYNPAIFTYDYEKIKARCFIYKEDIMKNRFHPRNIPKFRAWGIDGFEDYEDE